jgi:hypothetical protein
MMVTDASGASGSLKGGVTCQPDDGPDEKCWPTFRTSTFSSQQNAAQVRGRAS